MTDDGLPSAADHKIPPGLHPNTAPQTDRTVCPPPQHIQLRNESLLWIANPVIYTVLVLALSMLTLRPVFWEQQSKQYVLEMSFLF